LSEFLDEAKRRQETAAHERFEAQAAHRAANVEALEKPGGLAEVNSAAELARRLDRVTRYLAGEPLPVTPVQVPAAGSDPERVIDVALERAATQAADSAAPTVAEVAASVSPGMTPHTDEENAAPPERAGIVLERIIGTADFVGIRYLEAGVASSRAVCRVDIRDELGRTIGYGTGSLVSPRLLLTNHHVLPSADVARTSAAEFNYEDGIDGKPLQPVLYPLDPDTFFFNDQTRDFALVAVRASEAEIERFGMNRLIEAQGKAIIGDFVTIVQHPGGEKKQVALRDNRIVDELEFFLHYQADTEPGSSGSPVFNDQWEVVALHHASVPTPERGPNTYLNEGIRASRILQFVAQQQFPNAQQALADQLNAPERITIPADGVEQARRAAQAPKPPSASRTARLTTASQDAADGGLAWTLPVELYVELRAPRGSAPTSTRPAVSPAPPSISPAPAALERLVEPYHDADLANRHGYDANFLGVAVPVPELVDEDIVARLNDGSYELAYEHFSIVMNKTRRIALYTASNVDASAQRKHPEPDRDYSRRGLSGLGDHDQEKWFIDPRIADDEQLPDKFFTRDHGAFDKGHIVRRDDAAWGDSYDELRRANGDTYHATNCSPQVANFNRSNLQGLWGELENIVSKQAATERYCILAGPLVRDDDPMFVGVDDSGTLNIRIPKQFWKIIVAHDGNSLQSFAFLLEQDLSNLEFAVDAEWQTRMIAIAELEGESGLVTFPQALHESDQSDADSGEAVRAQAGIERFGV
jgi:endonuclease G, mitochondrial